MPVAYLFFFCLLYLSFYFCFPWQCTVSSYIFHSNSWEVWLSSLQLIAFCLGGASIPGHPIEHSQVVDVAALGSGAGWLDQSVDDDRGLGYHVVACGGLWFRPPTAAFSWGLCSLTYLEGICGQGRHSKARYLPHRRILKILVMISPRHSQWRIFS